MSNYPLEEVRSTDGSDDNRPEVVGKKELGAGGGRSHSGSGDLAREQQISSQILFTKWLEAGGLASDRFYLSKSARFSTKKKKTSTLRQTEECRITVGEREGEEEVAPGSSDWPFALSGQFEEGRMGSHQGLERGKWSDRKP